ncbi:MAG: glycosyltransferase family 2 protein [Candidatus Liptonbacteria bacterium]|nr:glycosyltransferase family 2 protein [Candidatus Liptonbacteria bacterium]
MKIVMPMAGRGSRFTKIGVTTPKPLIEVLGKTMVQWSIEGMRHTRPEIKDSDFVFICHADHERDYGISARLQRIAPGATVLFTPVVTEGAACTVLLAKRYIDDEEDMLMVDSDHFVVCPEFRKHRELAIKNDWGGLIPTFERTAPNYSYARIDEQGNVVETREKQVISTHAAVMYYFTKWKYFVSAAEAMIQKNIRYNNEFYMCPVYNEVIAQGHIVRTIPVELAMHLGTPEELQYFIEHVPEKYR